MVEEVAGMTDQERVGITDLVDDVNVREGDGLFSSLIYCLNLSSTCKVLRTDTSLDFNYVKTCLSSSVSILCLYV